MKIFCGSCGEELVKETGKVYSNAATFRWDCSLCGRSHFFLAEWVATDYQLVRDSVVPMTKEAIAVGEEGYVILTTDKREALRQRQRKEEFLREHSGEMV